MLIVLPVSTYTGWYYGKITGYEKAKHEKSEDINYTQKRETNPNKLKYKTKIQANPNQFNYKKPQKTAQQSLREMNQIVEETRRLSYKQARSNPTKTTEKGAECRWTVGRIEELERIINTGGKGRKSNFCGEYNSRIGELYRLNCQTRILETIC